jgi:hypothetical protein
MAEPQPPHDDVISSVLSFYGSELTSHASLIVGFVVALFTLAQARQSILSVGFPPWGFEFVVFTMVFAVVYSMFRVVLYGGLSGVLMGSSVKSYEEFLSTKRGRLFPHADVNLYAMYELFKYSKLRRVLYKPRGYYNKRLNRNAAFITQLPVIVSFVIAYSFTTAMFGISAEWLGVLGGLIVLMVLANFVSIRWAVPATKAASDQG